MECLKVVGTGKPTQINKVSYRGARRITFQALAIDLQARNTPGQAIPR
jgi:hypothetical protein